MNPEPALLLSRNDVARLIEISECITAVESAFRLFAEGKAESPKVFAVHVDGGGFHIKAGHLGLDRHYFVAKSNGNFPGNPEKFGLPTIQGIVLVCDADNGRVLAVMDSIELTILRTGAATAVAAKYLARQDSSVVTICGCGNQGRISLRALVQVCKNIKVVHAYDSLSSRAVNFGEDLSRELDLQVIATGDLKAATLQSDICITCTPSKKALLFKDYIRPGTFIAAVGADSPEKSEIDPQLIASSKLVVDLADQSATIGDFSHALQVGLVTRQHIHAELGEIIAGKKPGREHEEEIIIFDSTGTALQDVASAAIVYERARKENKGQRFDFGSYL